MRKGFFITSFLLILIFVSGCTKTAQDEPKQITDSSYLDVKERGKLVIGTQAEYEPMEFKDANGNIVGLEVDIMKDLAKEMGVELELKEVNPWSDLFNQINTGEIDLAMCIITITTERQKSMLFSVPYFDAGQVIIVRKDYAEIASAADLKGKKIGVLPETTCKSAALEYGDEELVIDFENYEDGSIPALKSGEIDAIVTDLIGASGFVKNHPDLKVMGEPFTQEFYGIATNLENRALMDEINRILREMKRSGKLKEIENNWLS